ncbi:MAG: hypothetical protein PWP27_1097 [Clostridiales bacterium]|jgi:DNA-binding MarR family transcriptional regulator|nr:hypothetical protein [Clostridiales bacterium]MDK2933287.1 hypothetical protein [Clostridiales bacterium]
MRDKNKSIGRWISILYRYGQCYFEKELRPYKIGSGQFIFLLALLEQDGISQESLSNHLNIDKGTTARAIKKLEAAGYIVRRTDPDDKRANRVYVTEKALEIRAILGNITKKWTDLLSVDFTAEEKEIIIDLLKRMSQNAASFIKEN